MILSMRFQYTFQKIVDLKNNERTQAEWVLADAIGKLRSEEEQLAELEDYKLRVQEQLVEVSSHKTTISEMLLMQHYVDQYSNRINAKHQSVQEAHHNVQNKQEYLTDKMLEEKVWAKARERAHHTYVGNLLHKEQLELDEMATNRFKKMS
jgi:flagellar FliJ protein